MDWIALGVKILKYDPPFEYRIMILAIMLVVIPITNILYFYILHRLPATSKYRKGFLKISSGTFNIVSWSFFLLTVLISMFIRPFIIDSIPSVESGISNGAPHFVVEFDMPVSDKYLKFNISPEIKGEWKPINIAGTNLARKYKFYPEESIYPGNPVVIYVTGIKTPWSLGKKHEQPIEYAKFNVPNIKKVTPEDKSINVPTKAVIELDLDSYTGEFIKWNVESEPVIEGITTTNKNKQLIITFENELSQDQQYTFKIYQTPRSYNVETGEDIEVGETKLVKTLSFTTVSTPLVKSYTPKGENVLATSEIKVEFDQEMDQAEIEKNLKIEPDLKGKLEWINPTTFIYKSEAPLVKDTDYSINIPAGIHSMASGATKEPIKLTFRTIGKVKPLSISPLNGSTGNAVSGLAVVVVFDQNLDHTSAESLFSITPKVNGTFAWVDNQMTFTPSGTLAYGTTYTVALAPGIKSYDGLDSDTEFKQSFTTKAQIVKLNVPWYGQQEGFTCNIAATRMVLAYRGIYKSENEIRNAIGIGENPNANWVNGYGVHAGPINSYISGFRGTNYQTGMSISQLTAQIDAGYPVITWVYNRYSKPYGAFTLPGGYTGYTGMHSEIVTGYSGDASNPTYIYTNDPWRGHLTYTQTNFKSIWAYLGYTGVAVK